MITCRTTIHTVRLATAFILAMLFLANSSSSLDFPRVGRFFGLSRKSENNKTREERRANKADVRQAEILLSEASTDEMREEERMSEVLNQDASYLSLFQSIHNPDVNLANLVKTGEVLKYQASWRGLPAGTIRCAAKRQVMLKERPVFVFEFNVESNDFLSAFYPVKTSINSYVDADTGRSYLIRRRVSESKRSYKDRLEFKYDHRRDNGIPEPVSKYSFVGESGREEASAPFPIPGSLQDMVSVIYYIRGLELNSVGDSCHLLIGGRKKPVITAIKVINEEELDIPGVGTFDALVVEPTTDGTNLSGNFLATRGGERVWLEKNSRIPLMCSAKLPSIGDVVATLVEAENSVLAQYAKRDE